jgi:hypothetical protein
VLTRHSPIDITLLILLIGDEHVLTLIILIYLRYGSSPWKEEPLWLNFEQLRSLWC